jgi:hypothetical protein
MENYEVVAFGGETISGGSITVDLKVPDSEKKWSGSGSYVVGIAIYITGNNKAFATGSGDNPAFVNFTNANTTVPFSQFGIDVTAIWLWD